jgi:hypothetical protein
MPSDIIALPVTDAEALKQELNTLAATADAIEEKAVTTHRHILAAHQLLDEEQAAIVDLE